MSGFERRAPENKRSNLAGFVICAVLLFSLACALPFTATPTPTRWSPSPTPSVEPTPSPTPLPLPPALVESDPPQTAELPLSGPITLYFNQGMDRASVETALRSQMQQELAFTWVDDSTVVVRLSAPLDPDAQVSLMVTDSMRSRQGKPLFQPVSLNYRTAGFLALSQSLPQEGTQDVDPTGAVVASFNRPIVPLGSSEGADLPEGFSLEPAASGRGEWINTSTYAFYPDPALSGGVTYTVRVNPNLKSVDGGPLRAAEPWSFTTTQPRLLSTEPVTETPWPLDAVIKLTFNQPMQAGSVEAGFSLSDSNGAAVAGKTEWSEDGTVFTFTPDALLQRGAIYRMRLTTAAGVGGTPLVNDRQPGDDVINAEVVTVSPPAVTRAEPAEGGQMSPADAVALYFNSPIDPEDVETHLALVPAVADLNAYWDEGGWVLRVNGSFAPNTEYTLRVLPSLKDSWGGPVQEFELNFTTTAYTPSLNLLASASTIFLTGQDRGLVVQAVNLTEVPLTLGGLTLDEFFKLNAPGGYELMEALKERPGESWSQPVNTSSERMSAAELPLSQAGDPRPPGLYFLRFRFPEDTSGVGGIYNGPYLLAVSNLQLTFKTGPADALIWAVDLRSGAPAADAPITIFNEAGEPLAQGLTDADGIFRASFKSADNPYEMKYAVIAQPGDPNFGMAMSSWTAGIEPWDFGLIGNYEPPGLKIYFYTDRPIYRPGQKAYFRAVLREAFNGRYSPPQISSLPIKIFGSEGQELASIDLPISAMGTAYGEFVLPADAPPGYYNITTEAAEGVYFGFQVASYRKPEINLQVNFDAAETNAGDPLRAEINARYFFDAPAGRLPVQWMLYRRGSTFNLPGYTVGLADTSWVNPFRYPDMWGGLGELVKEGTGITDSDGRLAVEIPIEADDARWNYTLEATITDESGLPVSARGSTAVNPDRFYIGIRPDSWVGRAGDPAGFDVRVVDWRKDSAGETSLRANFKKVTWRRVGAPITRIGDIAEYLPEYTAIGSADFSTSAAGEARLQFIPPDPGTYLLDVFSLESPAGRGAHSQFLLWVGGAGRAVWPNLPNSRLQLTADRDDYLPGDTAQVFIPNPYGREVRALITFERQIVMSHELITVGAEGQTVELPLPADYAPNVYLSVTLLGVDGQGRADFRQGYLNLPVKPVEQALQVKLIGAPQRAGPGEMVTFEIAVSDSNGNPVQGEFSLSVVDLAVLALADPNSIDIVSAFYGEQPIGVRTSLALAAYNRRMLELPGGLGGGGGADIVSVTRENFPDTAFWKPVITTDANGRATLAVELPDTLTTWQVDTRGLTADTRVGEAETQVITSKELLIRPVTPRFFVVDDHVELAAVVQNNTTGVLEARVLLQANGFTPDDPAALEQPVTVPAGGRARVAWWGTVQDVPSVDLVFSAVAGQLRDAARPNAGDIPVLRYYTPQTYRTSGQLAGAGEVTELISLPRAFDPQNGRLNLELSPSLAAAMLRALDALETGSFESVEQTISGFLPNLETYRALQEFGIEDAALKARLDENLNTALVSLLARQSYTGGWSWWRNGETDPFITSYVLYSLVRARQAGITISSEATRKAVEYLQTDFPMPPGSLSTEEEVLPASGSWPPAPWEWDRMAFQQFALAETGNADPDRLTMIFDARDQLSPWSQALLALAFENTNPGAAEAQTLLADLEAKAMRTATGAYWEMSQDENGRMAAGYNMQSNLAQTAIVIYALAQRDPGSPLVADAVRYLMANRGADGAWNSSYTTAWSLIGLSQVLRGTGELAGSYTFDAVLNNNPFAKGQVAAGGGQTTPVTAGAAIQQLYPDYPNALTVRRSEGPGQLYYTVGLEVSRPVADVPALAQGVSISRAFYPFGDACPNDRCDAIQTASAGQKVQVRLSLTVPHDAYYLAVSDYIPAGAEILDPNLKTTQQGIDAEPQSETLYDPRRPFAQGWGWWLFNAPKISDDHILWTADRLPAGTYELTYTIVLLQPGQFRVLPARAWQLYFPEVQGNSAGSTFEIRP